MKRLIALTLGLSIWVTGTSRAGSWDSNFSSTFPTGWGNATAVTGWGTNVFIGTEWGMIYKWNASAGWTQVLASGTWIDGPIRFLSMNSGTLYFGGAFETGWNGLGDVTLNNVGRVNLSTGVFSPLGSGVIGTIYTMVTGPQSLYRHDFLYVGGILTSAGGISVNNVASYNGGWSNMRNGLTFADPTQTGKGVHSLCLWQDPSAPGTSYILAAGRFESANGVTLAGPNIARFSEDMSGNSSWTSVGLGLGVIVRDPNTCVITRAQGFDCFVRQAVAIGTPATAYLALSQEFTHINGNYQLVTCQPPDWDCVCGQAPTYYQFAKAGVSSGAPAFWDGSQGWYPNLSPEWGGAIWADGGTIYGIVSVYGGTDFYIGKYVPATASWTTVSSALPEETTAGNPRSHFMTRAGTSIYLAGGIPQRWIP